MVRSDGQRCYDGSLLAADVVDLVTIQALMGHSAHATAGRRTRRHSS
jgi:hypothetical protein